MNTKIHIGPFQRIQGALSYFILYFIFPIGNAEEANACKVTVRTLGKNDLRQKFTCKKVFWRKGNLQN